MWIAAYLGTHIALAIALVAGFLIARPRR
jgi:hypothetical protein